jgi:predicted RNA-binding Zn-ribbon protein involved in translation (DUF1610 family)
MLKVSCIIDNKIYFVCSCGYNIGSNEEFVDWNYCPRCGEVLAIE